MAKFNLPIRAGDQTIEWVARGIRFVRSWWMSRNYTSITISANESTASVILGMVDKQQGQHFRFHYSMAGYGQLQNASPTPDSGGVRNATVSAPRYQQKAVLELVPIPEGESLDLVIDGQTYRLTVYTETVPSTGEDKPWLTIITKGRGQKPFMSLVKAIEKAFSEDQEQIWVHSWVSGGGYWKAVHRIDKRGIGTVMLPKNGAQKLLEDARTFLASRATYSELGVPFRRGYLLQGVPRSGKSATILAIASELNLGIHVLNLSGDTVTDETVIQAFTDLPQPAILVLEDIDAMSSVELTRSEDKGGYPKGVSLATLLNCLDGSYAGTNRLVFLTTNHPEKLDPALIGAGRVDVVVEYDYLCYEQAQNLWELYYPTAILPEKALKDVSQSPKDFVVADLQACFQKHLGDPSGAVQEMVEMVRHAK